MKVGEIFYSVVLDSGKAEKGLKRIEKTINRMDKAGKSINKTFNTLASLLGFAGVSKMVSESAQIGRSMELLSDQTGIATSELSRLKTAFSAAGVNGNKLDSVLNKINNELLGIQMGNADSGALSRIGISPRNKNGKFKNPLDVLKEVADWSKRTLDTGGAKGKRDISFALSQLVGTDQQMANLLMGGSAALEEYINASANRFGSLNDRQIKDLSELKGALDGLVTSGKTLGETMVADLSPYLKEMADTTTAILGTLREKWGLKPIDDSLLPKALATQMIKGNVSYEAAQQVAQRQGYELSVRDRYVKVKDKNGKVYKVGIEDVYPYQPFNMMQGFRNVASWNRLSGMAEEQELYKGKMSEFSKIARALNSGNYTKEDADKAYAYGMINGAEYDAYLGVADPNYTTRHLLPEAYAINDKYARAAMEADWSQPIDVTITNNPIYNKDGTIQQDTSVEVSGGGNRYQSSNSLYVGSN